MALRKPPMERSTADAYAMDQANPAGRPPGGGPQRRKPGQPPQQQPMAPPPPAMGMAMAPLPKVPDSALVQAQQEEPYSGGGGGMRAGMPSIMQLIQMLLSGQKGRY